jgi:hypothetical protein
MKLPCIITWCALAVSLQPSNGVVQDRVDLIEVNHYYDEHGEAVFDQVIFYDWSPRQSRFHIRAWRLLKSPEQVPHRDWKRRDFVSLWYDGDQLREVRTPSVCETWTQHDPEQAERRQIPRAARRELSKPLISLVR